MSAYSDAPISIVRNDSGRLTYIVYRACDGHTYAVGNLGTPLTTCVWLVS